MKSEDRQVIEQKLTSLDRYLAELTPYLRIASDKFEHDLGRQRIVERLVQVIVECAVDSNNLLIRALGLPAASSARESFQRLKEYGILDDYVTTRYVEKYVGLRNVIVHLYEKVEAKTLYFSAKRLLKDSDAYARQIHKRLAERSGKTKS